MIKELADVFQYYSALSKQFAEALEDKQEEIKSFLRQSSNFVKDVPLCFEQLNDFLKPWVQFACGTDRANYLNFINLKEGINGFQEMPKTEWEVLMFNLKSHYQEVNNIVMLIISKVKLARLDFLKSYASLYKAQRDVSDELRSYLKDLKFQTHWEELKAQI